MSLDIGGLKDAVNAHGRVVRVVVASVEGSAPREAGASMLVWDQGQVGTIGGGALEFAAAEEARKVMVSGQDSVRRKPLGPALGQCCGGAVVLVYECFDAERVASLGHPVILRRVKGEADVPLALKRIHAKARNAGADGDQTETMFQSGWLLERVHKPTRNIWIYGAGHVGRALVDVLAPLPDLEITWLDTGTERFPACPHGSVRVLPTRRLAEAARLAPGHAEHLILTYSHALDLDICHALLRHRTRSIGLIGSATKWARFRSRLAALGHTHEDIATIRCPIGDPGLGKHPQAIAVGVAAQILGGETLATSDDTQGDLEWLKRF